MKQVGRRVVDTWCIATSANMGLDYCKQPMCMTILQRPQSQVARLHMYGSLLVMVNDHTAKIEENNVTVLLTHVPC